MSAGHSPPFLTIRSSRRPTDGQSVSSGDSTYGSSLGDEKTPSATHDISRVSYHVKCLPEFAQTLEDSATRAFPNRGGSQRYKKVHVILLHWRCDDLFVLPELEDLEQCFREDYKFETETFPIPTDNAHLELMLRIGAMIKEHESNDTLFIVYYGGHARIDESRQSTWCATRSSDSPWLQWSAIQTLLERSLSDVLILLDCCAGAASATFPNGNSITETISASSWDAIAPDPGRYSFTNALIEVLQEWKRRTFSAAMLHAEVLARLKHPRPVMLNGKQFEARSTPVHFMMTANHRAPSIELSQTVSADMRPPSPPRESTAARASLSLASHAGRSAGLQEIIGSEPNEDVPHVMISLALEEDQQLNINDWEQWLKDIPALAKYVKVQGVFKSHSNLLLLSLPVMVWDLLPENLACNFIAFIRSNNLAMEKGTEQGPIAGEVETGFDVDGDLGSMLSGTTAITSAPMEWLRAGRFSMLSAGSGRNSALDYRGLDRRGSRYSTDKPLPGWPGSPHGPPVRQRTAPVSGLQSKSDDVATRPHPRSPPRTNRPELPPHVQTRLEEVFSSNTKPTAAVKEFLASNYGIETADIDIWFYHRREQQEVSNRLRNLKIDDQSPDASNESARMILPSHLSKLLEIFPAGGILVVDLRAEVDYERSHIHGAVNIHAPATFIARASMEMIERSLPDDASRSSFNRWHTSKCVVFYDKVVEYSWEAPAAEVLVHKFQSEGWSGQSFILKGHYREFSQSFDKYIVGTRKTTESAQEHPASLQGESAAGKNQQQQQQQQKTDDDDADDKRYQDWLKLIADEDRVHSTDLAPAARDERVREMVRQQRTLEHEFEKREPALHRRALDRPAPPETDWAARRTKAPMVAHHLSRGIDKMREAQLLLGGGRSGPSPSDDLSEDDHHRQHEPGYQKIPGAAATTFPPLPRQDEPGADKKGRSTLGGGGRNLFTKIMRSGRPEAPR